MSTIVPAILAHSEEEFEQQLRLIENDCELIQVDILDGSLFPNTNWFDAERVGALRSNVHYELHLMVENPIPIIQAWQKFVPNLERVIVSAEMHRPLIAVLQEIKMGLGLKVGVAINPETPLHEVESVIHELDQLTIMSVHPGKQGQAFGDAEHIGDESFIFEKIKLAHDHRADLIIEIDGGVRDDLIGPLMHAGVDRIVVGSLLFKTEDPTNKLKLLNKIVSV